MRIDDLDHLPETTTIDASSIGIVQVGAERPCGRGVGTSRCADALGVGPPEPRQESGALGKPRGPCVVSHLRFLLIFLVSLSKSLLVSVSF